jgi:hypothetical protein
MSMGRINLFRTFIIIAIVITLTGQATADEKDDATGAARTIMNVIAQKNFGKLWDQLTSDVYRKYTGNSREAFVANFTISRVSIGNLKSSKILDIQISPSDQIALYNGKIYSITFQNSYDTGNTYEKIVVIEENGAFKLGGLWGAPAD